MSPLQGIQVPVGTPESAPPSNYDTILNDFEILDTSG